MSKPKWYEESDSDDDAFRIYLMKQDVKYKLGPIKPDILPFINFMSNMLFENGQSTSAFHHAVDLLLRVIKTEGDKKLSHRTLSLHSISCAQIGCKFNDKYLYINNDKMCGIIRRSQYFKVTLNSEIKKMLCTHELKVMKLIKYEICRAQPIEFLSMNIKDKSDVLKKMNVDPDELRRFGIALIECCLMNYGKYVKYSRNQVANSCTKVAYSMITIRSPKLDEIDQMVIRSLIYCVDRLKTNLDSMKLKNERTLNDIMCMVYKRNQLLKKANGRCETRIGKKRKREFEDVYKNEPSPVKKRKFVTILNTKFY